MTVSLNIEGLDQPLIVGDEFKDLSPDEKDNFVLNAVEQVKKGAKSSLGSTSLPTQSTPQFDAMGNPTGGTEENIVPPQTPYGEQMGNVARDTGAVAKTLAGGIIPFGLADRGVAALRAASGDAPDYQTALAQEQAATNATGANVPGLNTAIKMGGAALLGPVMGAYGAGGRLANAGYGLLPRAAGYGADAAAFGAAQEAGNVPAGTLSDYLSAAGQGAKTGAIIGAGLPIGGAIGGAIVRKAGELASRVPGVSRATVGLLSPAVTPEAVTAAGGLGPSAMVADVSPATQGLAQGIAAKTDQPANDLLAALRARRDLTPQRLSTDINANLGPALSPVQLETGLTAQQRTASPLYQSALANAPAQVQPTGALAEIGTRLNSAPEGSPMRAALQRARTMMMRDTNAGPVPVTDAPTLLNVRHELDNMIDYGSPDLGLVPGAARGEASPLRAVRGELDQTLKQSLPGLQRADEIYAQTAAQRAALEQGRRLFQGGHDAILPQDLRTTLAQASPGEQLYMRQGARSAVENAVGTSPQDLARAKGLFGDPLDWNRAKAAQVFGAQPTERMVNAIEREQRFAETANPAIAGARTAPMGIAARTIDKASEPTIQVPSSANLFGILANRAAAATNKLLGANAERAGAITRQELSGILQMSPQDAQNILQSILANKAAAANRGQAVAGILGNPYLARAGLSTYQALPSPQQRR